MKLALLFIIALLTGCSTLTKEVIVYKKEPVFINTPVQLTSNCLITPPPSKQEYLLASMQKREEYLATYVRSLITDLGVCNSKLADIRTWNKEQEIVFKPR